MSEIRPSVQWFAEQMEAKLQRDDATKPGWSTETTESLFRGLVAEVIELHEALLSPIAAPEYVVTECADVANYAMMIADVCHRQFTDRGRTAR
jgi:NTP pyrophosphatase (non-canonical NTP hydrolase)